MLFTFLFGVLLKQGTSKMKLLKSKFYGTIFGQTIVVFGKFIEEVLFD